MSVNDGNKQKDSIDIKQLIIKLQTNIPEMENKEFTRDILYNPALNTDSFGYLNNYPFITSDYKFNSDIISYEYNNIYAFFFNKKIFDNKLRRNLYGIKHQYADPKNDKEKEDILEHNINILLQALFPLHSKVSEGYINAFDKNTSNIANSSTLFNSMKNKMNFKEFYKHIYSLFKNLNYTCLNSGEKYTITRIIWLNDTKTNPIFKQFLKDYKKLNNWIENQSANIQTKIMTNTFEQNYLDYNKNKYNANKTLSVPNNPFNDTFADYNKDEYMNYADFYKMLQNSQLRNILNKDIKDRIDGVISKYTNSNDIKPNFYEFMNNIYNKSRNIIGFKSLSKSGYEINVLMDCIKGEITSDNFNKLKCNYNSNKLGELIEYKLNKFDNDVFDEEFFKNHKLFSINDNKIIESDNNKGKEGKNNNQVVGGKQRSITCNNRINKLKKHKKTRKNI